MSNTALSSARRRRAVPPIVALNPQQQQQQQRMIELQRQQQQQQQQQPLGPGGSASGPYTQRPSIPTTSIPTNANARSLQHSTTPQQPQFIKPGTVIPPGYVQTIHANGMPQVECVETGTINFPYGEAPLPPIIILRNHDKQLIQIDGQQNDFANQLAHITSRIAAFEGNVNPNTAFHDSTVHAGDELAIDDEFIKELAGNSLFISSTVETIMKNTNLSDMVNEIEPIKAENRELRSLLLSQQEMLNGMNSLLFKLLNTMHNVTNNNTSVVSGADVTTDDRNDAHFGAFEQSPRFPPKSNETNTAESINDNEPNTVAASVVSEPEPAEQQEPPTNSNEDILHSDASAIANTEQEQPPGSECEVEHT